MPLRMRERKWTLLLLGDDPQGIRQLTLSPRAVALLTGGVAVLSLVLIALAGFLLLSGGAHLRAQEMARENAILTRELSRFQERVVGLEEVLDQLSEQDSQIRILAGLDAVDQEVQQAGIGGPGLTTPDAHPLWQFDSAMGKGAFAVEYDLGALERRARVLSASLSEARDSLSSHRDLLEATPSILPVAGMLTSRFTTSRIHPISHRALPHEGVDISAPAGTPILASAKGTVVHAGWLAGLGYTVEIDHGYGYLTRYGHASKLLVRRGQRVDRGEVIAHVGSTGISTSPHLHYEVRIGGRAVNPMNYVIGNVIP
jgi:murein DD-endopeptidase MepM/ murein hydrolase activator NlpD